MTAITGQLPARVPVVKVRWQTVLMLAGYLALHDLRRRSLL